MKKTFTKVVRKINKKINEGKAVGDCHKNSVSSGPGHCAKIDWNAQGKPINDSCHGSKTSQKSGGHCSSVEVNDSCHSGPNHCS